MIGQYPMALTADFEEIARRGTSFMVMYCWRRGLFAVMYEGMTKEAIASAVAQRKEGYMGGMPEGAVIDVQSAIDRVVAGEQAFLTELKTEPLLVALSRGKEKRFTLNEMTVDYIGQVMTNLQEEAGFEPGSGGINNIRRGTMVSVVRARSGGFRRPWWMRRARGIPASGPYTAPVEVNTNFGLSSSEAQCLHASSRCRPPSRLVRIARSKSTSPV